MNCLSWRSIFHKRWGIKSKFQIGGLRETGSLPLFSPEGRTYSPPRRHKLHILRPAASGRSHPFRCASFSHKVNDFVGALLRRWYACGIVRSPRGIAAAAAASRQCHKHLRGAAVIICADGKFPATSAENLGQKFSTPVAACLRKPAPGSFAAEMDGRPARPFSLLRKRNRKKKTR